MPDKLPYDGYIRVSQVAGRGGDSFLSPKIQRETIERLALANGVPLGEVVEELDVSGGKQMKDRELDRLVQNVLDGKSGGLLVWKVSRFSRNLIDCVTVVDAIRKAGGRVVGSDGTSDSKAMMGFLAGRAEEELDERRAGWAAAVDSAIDRSVYVGPTPVGFDRLDGGLIKDEDGKVTGTKSGDKRNGKLRKNADAVHVAHIFEMRSNGGSWSECARYLDAAGVKTGTGLDRWGLTSVTSLVRNPIYKGILANGREHFVAEYAVVSAATWDAAQSKRREPDAPERRASRSEWAILTGLVHCASCGHRMVAGEDVKRGKDGKPDVTYRAYRCQNLKCSARARADAALLEPAVCGLAFEMFETLNQNPGVGHDDDVARIAELEEAVRAATAEESAFLVHASAAAAGFAEGADARRVAVETAEAALDAERKSRRVAVSADEQRAAWDAADVEGRRMLVREMISRVTVARGKAPLAERVEVEWPDGVRFGLGDGAESADAALSAAVGSVTS